MNDETEAVYRFSDSETEGFDELVKELGEEDLNSADNSELFLVAEAQDEAKGVDSEETGVNNESHQTDDNLAHDAANSQQKADTYTSTTEQSNFFPGQEQREQVEAQRTDSLNSGHLSEDELFERLEHEGFDEADAEEILSEQTEIQLSVKEKVQLFERMPIEPKTIIPHENERTTRPKTVYIPKQEIVAESSKPSDLEMLYRNTLTSIMNPFFVGASIYATIRLILAIICCLRNNC